MLDRYARARTRTRLARRTRPYRSKWGLLKWLNMNMMAYVEQEQQNYIYLCDM